MSRWVRPNAARCSRPSLRAESARAAPRPICGRQRRRPDRALTDAPREERHGQDGGDEAGFHVIHNTGSVLSMTRSAPHAETARHPRPVRQEPHRLRVRRYTQHADPHRRQHPARGRRRKPAARNQQEREQHLAHERQRRSRGIASWSPSQTSRYRRAGDRLRPRPRCRRACSAETCPEQDTEHERGDPAGTRQVVEAVEKHAHEAGTK